MTVTPKTIRHVFVAGTWSSVKAKSYAKIAYAVGQGLAQHGFDLTTGPGTGISGEVIAGYKSVSERGIVRVYLPSPEHMKLAGEQVAGEFDEVIQTDFDYPMRNVFHIKHSDALVVITGGDGTLEECLPALIDYDLPTIVVRDSGPAARALTWLAENIFPEWKSNLHFATSAEDVLEVLVTSSQPSHLPRHSSAIVDT
jgi:uncharacterized protein (TIGR00725 family)